MSHLQPVRGVGTEGGRGAGHPDRSHIDYEKIHGRDKGLQGGIRKVASGASSRPAFQGRAAQSGLAVRSRRSGDYKRARDYHRPAIQVETSRGLGGVVLRLGPPAVFVGVIKKAVLLYRRTAFGFL